MNAPPQRVVFVLPDLAGGGAQSVMLNVAGELDRRRYQVSLLVAGSDRTLADRVPERIEFEAGEFSKLRQGLPWLIRRIRFIKPDAVISVMGYLNISLLAFRCFFPRRTRVIVREANALDATLRNFPLLLRMVCPYRRLYPKAAAIVAPTAIIAKQISEVAPAAAERVRVIPNPVNTKMVRSRAPKPKRRDGKGLRLVAAGRLTHQKGFDRLLDMACQLPATTRIDVFGDGSDLEKLQRKAHALGLVERVSFRGFSNELPSWLAGADAFVLPSRWEGLPNVVLESLAVGTPAIISDDAAADDLVRNAVPGSVTSVPVGDAFVRSIKGITPLTTTPSSPRDSLLPEQYEVDHIGAVWADLIAPQEEIVSHRDPPNHEASELKTSGTTIGNHAQ